ncbi:MAG: hypothetical protein AAFV88_11640 [Planctomycetota bacterium]
MDAAGELKDPESQVEILKSMLLEARSDATKYKQQWDSRRKELNNREAKLKRREDTIEDRERDAVVEEQKYRDAYVRLEQELMEARGKLHALQIYGRMTRVEVTDVSEEEVERLKESLRECRGELEVVRRHSAGEFWYHQGDGHDEPESLTCPVLMSAEDYLAQQLALKACDELLSFVHHGMDDEHLGDAYRTAIRNALNAVSQALRPSDSEPESTVQEPKPDASYPVRRRSDGIWMASADSSESAARRVAVDCMNAFGMDPKDDMIRVKLILAIADRVDGMLNYVSRKSEERASKQANGEVKALMDAMEAAWGVIANVGVHSGGWESQSGEWCKAACRWRDEQWHPALERNGYTPRESANGKMSGPFQSLDHYFELPVGEGSKAVYKISGENEKVGDELPEDPGNHSAPPSSEDSPLAAVSPPARFIGFVAGKHWAKPIVSSGNFRQDIRRAMASPQGKAEKLYLFSDVASDMLDSLPFASSKGIKFAGVDLETAGSEGELFWMVFEHYASKLPKEFSSLAGNCGTSMEPPSNDTTSPPADKTIPDPGPDHVLVDPKRDRFEDHKHHAEYWCSGNQDWIRSSNENWSEELRYRIPKGPLGDHRHWITNRRADDRPVWAVWHGKVSKFSAWEFVRSAKVWMPFVDGDSRPEPPAA